MSMPENPPAFPNTGNATWGLAADEGMSLRDYFAAHALSLIDHKTALDAARDSKDKPTAFIAGLAYQLADAMLAERSKS